MNLMELVNQKGLNQNEAFDILTSLATLIERGLDCVITPEIIEVKPNYEVEINEAVDCDDAYFMAPEQLFRGEKTDQNTALFSFGMLYYYVMNSKIWYVAQSVKVYEIENREIEIVSPGSPFAEINKLVSHMPYDRIRGFTAFFRQVESQPKGKVFINYICNRQVVAQEIVQLEEDTDDYAAKKKIRAVSGNVYIVSKGNKIKSRCTNQSVSIPVRLFRSANENIYEIRMQIDDDTENRIPLFDIGDEDKVVNHPISLGRIKKIGFWKMKVGSHDRVIEEIQLREIRMPKISQEALVRIKYDSVNSKAKVSLLSDKKRKRIIPRDILIDIDN